MTSSTHGQSAVRIRCAAAAALAIGALVPAFAFAQSAPAEPAPGTWRYGASIYVYLPTVAGSTAFPADSGGTPINVDAAKILDSLKMVFMGSFDAHNGTWGVFTDVVYIDLGNTKSNSRDFSIGNIGLPAGTTANLDWDLKGTAWTLAGQYRVSSDRQLPVDLLLGTRMFDLRQRLNWNITGSIGPLPPTSQSGSAEANETVWDAIIGVKGRYVFGADRKWAAPFYLDIGTGQSASTVQAAGGISYAFSWGEINGLWRYLGYHNKSGKAMSEVSFSGPQVGAVFRW